MSSSCNSFGNDRELGDVPGQRAVPPHLQPSNEIQQLFQRAMQRHQAGDLAGATELYCRVLESQPAHADALHLRGFAAFQSGDPTAGIRWIEQAVSLQPAQGEYAFNLALCYLASGSIEQAAAQLNNALKLRYADLETLRSVAWQLAQAGSLDTAEAGLKLCLWLDQEDQETQHLLAIVLKQAGCFEEAISYYERVIRRRPDCAAAYVNLGNAYRDSDRPEQSLVFYEQALRVDATLAAGHNNLALAHHALYDLAAADEALQKAIALSPESPEILNNLGNLLRDREQWDSSIDCFQKAYRLASNKSEILNNLAMTLRHADRRRDAVAVFEQSLVHDPDHVTVLASLAATLVELGETEAASHRYRQAANVSSLPDLYQLRADMECPLAFHDRSEAEGCWSRLQDQVQKRDPLRLPDQYRELVDCGAQPPFGIQFFPYSVRNFKEHYARLFSEVERWSPPRPAKRHDRSTDRARIGFVVTKGHEGVFLKSLGGVLRLLDQSQFELVLFCHPSAEERVRKELPDDTVERVSLPTRLDLAASAIQASQVDVLYYWEVGTDVINYFLPFLRLAPVQCTSWGIQVTSGIPQLDYYLSNGPVEPLGAESGYSEELLLSDRLLCYRLRFETRLASPPAEVKIGAKDHVYACLQQIGKFHPDFDEHLCGILESDPQATLLLTIDPTTTPGRIVQSRHARRMPQLVGRIQYLPRLDFAEYLAVLNAADVLLDPPHFGGVNSTYDGIALGKPIVTCGGGDQRSRYTLGCYRQMQYEVCVAEDRDSYIALATSLGTQPDFRTDVTRELLARHELLFEDQGAVREHERLFLHLMNKHF